jgi:pimeloyl-ACP methyl ester carboxylesterase
MAMFHARDLTRPWGRLRVWEAGGGTTVLAIHGLGGSGRYFHGLDKALGAGFRVLAPDLAGFGSSDTPEEHPLRDLHLADLEAVLETLAPEERVLVVGHSLGGVLGAMLAARVPERVAGLAVVCAPFPGDDDLDFRHIEDEMPAWRRWLFHLGRRAWPALAAPVAVVKRFPYAVVRDFGRQSFRARVWTMWSVLSDPGAADALAPLSERAPDTLLLDAIDDGIVPVEDRKRWAELIPGATQLILAEGEHQLLLRTNFEPVARWAGKVSAG